MYPYRGKRLNKFILHEINQFIHEMIHWATILLVCIQVFVGRGNDKDDPGSACNDVYSLMDSWPKLPWASSHTPGDQVQCLCNALQPATMHPYSLQQDTLLSRRHRLSVWPLQIHQMSHRSLPSAVNVSGENFRWICNSPARFVPSDTATINGFEQPTIGMTPPANVAFTMENLRQKHPHWILLDRQMCSMEPPDQLPPKWMLLGPPDQNMYAKEQQMIHLNQEHYYMQFGQGPCSVEQHTFSLSKSSSAGPTEDNINDSCEGNVRTYNSYSWTL